MRSMAVRPARNEGPPPVEGMPHAKEWCQRGIVGEADRYRANRPRKSRINVAQPKLRYSHLGRYGQKGEVALPHSGGL